MPQLTAPRASRGQASSSAHGWEQWKEMMNKMKIPKHRLEFQDKNKRHRTTNGSFPTGAVQDTARNVLVAPRAHGSTHRPGRGTVPGTEQRPRDTGWKTIQTAVLHRGLLRGKGVQESAGPAVFQRSSAGCCRRQFAHLIPVTGPPVAPLPAPLLGRGREKREAQVRRPHSTAPSREHGRPLQPRGRTQQSRGGFSGIRYQDPPKKPRTLKGGKLPLPEMNSSFSSNYCEVFPRKVEAAGRHGGGNVP